MTAGDFSLRDQFILPTNKAVGAVNVEEQGSLPPDFHVIRV